MILFFTKEQLEARIGAKRLKRICDDNNDGASDTDVILQLRIDASSKVKGYLEPIGVMPTYMALVDSTTGELLDDVNAPFDSEVTRLALDVGVAMAAQRHQEVMRVAWKPLMEQAEKELCDLRDGKTSLGGDGAPEVKNQGGTVIESAEEVKAETTQRHFDDMGIF